MAPARASRQGRAAYNNSNKEGTAKAQPQHQDQGTTGTAYRHKNKSYKGGRNQQGGHRWLASALGVDSHEKDGKGHKAEGKKRAPMTVGFQTPHGATAPDSAALATEAEEKRHKASLLRVAGFRERGCEEDIRCDEEYDWIPACCDDRTPLGMLDEPYESYGSSHEMQNDRQALYITGLPNELAAYCQVILEQAGLKGEILDWRFEQGKHSGAALAWLANRKLAEYAVWHFDGCSWTKDILVRARLVETPESIEQSEALTAKALDVLLAPPEEWVYDMCGNYVPESLAIHMQQVQYESGMSCSSMESDFEAAASSAPTDLWDFEEQVLPCLAVAEHAFTKEAEHASTPSSERLATIWEETCSDVPTTNEASTDEGASAGTSVTSETEDCHEGDEGSF
jgi:hypothetical protein